MCIRCDIVRSTIASRQSGLAECAKRLKDTAVLEAVLHWARYSVRNNGKRRTRNSVGMGQ